MPRPKQAAARKGLKFERLVAERLRPEAKANGWGFYWNPAIQDSRFDGEYHVPDIVLRAGDFSLLLECKLRFKDAGLAQLRRYAPRVSYIWGRPVIMCQVVNIMTPEAKDLPQVHSISQLALMRDEGPFVWFLPFPGVPNL